jgi:AraC family transcriptional regulator, regulatory protein of adaptative response / methylated-DNA-[protein]-cysteine methyltransferase
MARRSRVPHVAGMSTEQAWARVVAREDTSDFFFAVETTGIYCKPSCPARRPLQKNVSFFSTADDAERAGFRACRRCRPRDTTLVERARAYLDSRLDEQVTLDELATAVSASPFHVQRMFVRAMGMSPRAYVEKRRLARFAGGRSVLDAAFDAGFGSSRAIYEASKKPARGTIRYALGKSVHGKTLVAATERGICAASIGDSHAALVAELRAEFPRATLVRDDTASATDTLDLIGTPFQLRVWRALLAIPAGETRTYGDLARELATSPRAVARACASNRVALLIPCHRVIASDGDLTGYRWGLERKRALLHAESR